MSKKSVYIILCIFALLAANCRRERNKVSEEEIRQTEEALVGANRMMIKSDKLKVQEYIEEHNLSLVETKSGLWYGITSPGSGNKVKEDDLVTLEYSVSLLNGTMCYSSDSLGLKKFRVGKGGVESGLEEGILMLNEGSEAIFIMPPHLAHGLTGDGNRIPARAIIVYKVKLVNANQ